MLPEKIVLSKYLQYVSEDNGRDLSLFVYSGLTGQALKISRPTQDFLRLVERRSGLNAQELRDTVEEESLSIVRLLLESGILVGSQERELENCRERFPVSRGCLSYLNAKDKRIYVIPTRVDSSSGYQCREFTPDPLTLAFLEACDGERTLAQLIKLFESRWQLGSQETQKKIRSIILRLIRHDLQLLRFAPKKWSLLEGRSEHFPFLFNRMDDFSHGKTTRRIKRMSEKDETIDLESFHKKYITDAFHEFESVEITVSHAFRFPSAALYGKSYGGAFYQEAYRLGFLPKGAKVLEVGGGTGSFARAFLAEAKEHSPEAFSSLRYEIVDVSPELQRSQKELNSPNSGQMAFHLTNIEALQLPPGSVDFLLSNEVVADLRTVKLRKSSLGLKCPSKKPSAPQALSRYYIQKYDLPVSDAEPEFFFNLGTAVFIEKIYSLLKPGGHAFLSEFGGVVSYPKPTLHLNHDEYSIHWGQMAFLAKKLGFAKVELLDLCSFIRFDANHPMFSGDVYSLRHIFEKCGSSLDALAYTKEDLQRQLRRLPKAKIQGAEFSPLYREAHWGPSPWDFKVLLLSR